MNKPDLKSLIILFKAQQVIENEVKKSIVHTDLSVNEFAAMEAIYTKTCLTTQQLVELVLIPNSSMTHVLDTLLEKSYIKRERDPHDRRIQKLTLTHQGKSAFEKIYARHFDYMRKIFDVLSEREELQLQKLLKKLGKGAQAQQ